MEVPLIVLEKFKVDVAFLSMVQSALEDVLSLLREDTVYYAEDLVGVDLWADLTSPAQREAYICLQHLAEQPGAKLSYSRRFGQHDGGFQIIRNQ